MKVLVVSEGKHELGPVDATGSFGSDGALAVLVKRLIDQERVEITCDKASNPSVRTHQAKGRAGFTKRALGWVREAEKRGFDAIVLLIDQDRKPERSRQVSVAQADEIFRLPRAFGVAVVTFDAWMLADEAAWNRATGTVVEQQRNPESERQPKQKCETLRSACGSSLPMTKLYSALAAHASLDVLESRCPTGFAPFAARVRALHNAS